jgi:hypothetical protein
VEGALRSFARKPEFCPRQRQGCRIARFRDDSKSILQVDSRRREIKPQRFRYWPMG